MAVFRVYCVRCLSLALVLPFVAVGCNSDTEGEPKPVAREHAESAGTSKDAGETELLPSQVLDAEFFVDPINSDPRPVEVSERLTRAVLKMEDADREDKIIRAFIFCTKRNNELWVDSLHDRQETAFARQNRLINAGHVKPEDCVVRIKVPLRAPNNVDSAGTSKGVDEKELLASDVLDAVFFVDPISSDPRPVEVSERLTRAVLKMEDADREDKNIRAFIFCTKRNNELWVDSLHDRQETAFARQNRLINAGHVKPEDCVVRIKVPLRAPTK